MLSPETKIVCLSLHRSGTQSIDKFFKDYGLKSIHWGGWEIPEKENIYNLQIDEIINLFKDVANLYQCFSDHPFNLMHEYFDANYDNSKFIYIKRDVDSWIKSVKKLCSYRKNGFLKLYESIQYEKYINFRPKNIDDLSYDQMKYVYAQHEKEIKEYFKGKNNFFEINLDEIKDGIDILHFLNIEKIEGKDFPKIDSTRQLPPFNFKIY